MNSSAVFNGTIAVKQDLNLSGKLISNGPLAVNSINVSGNTLLANTAVNGSLTVKNALIAQGGLVLTGGLSINGNINGSGSATFSGDVSANSFSAKNTFYSGNFTINGHFQSSGAVPSISANTGIVGSGASVSIVGNDTSGFITVRIGANPSQLSAGTMANIAFRTAYNNGVTPRVVLTPANDKAALLHYYVVATNTAFQLRSADILPSNASNEYSFYYVTMQ